MMYAKRLSADDLLKDLNSPQREAVLHQGGPLMVLAGAGSGKTRVITYRIAYLLAEGMVQPWNILAMTFTNKAAQEMRQRVCGLVGGHQRDLWVSTFHSTCARLLRGHAHLLGFERDFVIFDDRDQLELVSRCLKELNLDIQRFPARMILTRIHRAKQDYRSPEDVLSDNEGDYLEQRVGKVYQLYQERLRQAQAMDFDDLLFQTLDLFNAHLEVLDYYRGRWQHILVDEFQDTNHIQYRLVKILSETIRNICVVGDDDQSIYSWRGADIANILGFEMDFPESRIIRLEQNYRSTQRILEASGGLILKNRYRKGKRLWTENEPGHNPLFYQAVHERDEAAFVADEILNLYTREGYSPRDLAIFYRTHAQSRVVEEDFLSRNIPFSIYGGVGFYERKEIKDIVAYLRALMHPSDDLSWRRILNTPKRGIGKVTLEGVESVAATEGIPFSLALRRFCIQAGTRRGPATRIRSFLEMMDGLASKMADMSVKDLVQNLLHGTGYWDDLQRDIDSRAQEKMDNIQELLNLIGEIETDEEQEGLNEFLEHVALVNDLDRRDSRADRVSLMTLHAAKGLEFPVVFIMGMEEGIMPHSLSLDEQSESEEERRLLYVGMTRAQKRLYILCAARRRIWGTVKDMEPSRFIGEIPRECLHLHSPPIAGPNHTTGLNADQPILYEGRWVRHHAFGVGTLRRIEQSGSRVVIHFPGIGERRFVLDLAPLEWI